MKQAYTFNPQIEQAALAMKNNEITIKGEKNGLLPDCRCIWLLWHERSGWIAEPERLEPGGNDDYYDDQPRFRAGIAGALQNLFTNVNPDYGVGVNLNIPLRNRTAQADQARSQMEYRQTQMRLQQLYTQIRIQVINGRYALTNDRASVQAAQTARDFQAQSLDAEQKKYKLGASTTANVAAAGAQPWRGGEDNLISATAAYAKDRAALEQLLSNTLDLYGISLTDAASGTVTQQPHVPGLTAPKAPAPPKPLSETPPPPPQ